MPLVSPSSTLAWIIERILLCKILVHCTYVEVNKFGGAYAASLGGDAKFMGHDTAAARDTVELLSLDRVPDLERASTYVQIVWVSNGKRTKRSQRLCAAQLSRYFSVNATTINTWVNWLAEHNEVSRSEERSTLPLMCNAKELRSQFGIAPCMKVGKMRRAAWLYVAL